MQAEKNFELSCNEPIGLVHASYFKYAMAFLPCNVATVQIAQIAMR
jgi:hypothetical protein